MEIKFKTSQLVLVLITVLSIVLVNAYTDIKCLELEADIEQTQGQNEVY